MEKECQQLLLRSLQYLERYIYLILFNTYLHLEKKDSWQRSFTLWMEQVQKRSAPLLSLSAVFHLTCIYVHKHLICSMHAGKFLSPVTERLITYRQMTKKGLRKNNNYHVIFLYAVLLNGPACFSTITQSWLIRMISRIVSIHPLKTARSHTT